MRGLAFADTHCAADSLWDNDSAKVVYTAYNTCCFHKNIFLLVLHLYGRQIASPTHF